MCFCICGHDHRSIYLNQTMGVGVHARYHLACFPVMPSALTGAVLLCKIDRTAFSYFDFLCSSRGLFFALCSAHHDAGVHYGSRFQRSCEKIQLIFAIFRFNDWIRRLQFQIRLHYGRHAPIRFLCLKNMFLCH